MLAEIKVLVGAPRLTIIADSLIGGSRNDFYAAYHSRFYRLPSEIREHRFYYEQERRAFGERAFHSMWYDLIDRLASVSFLEIGVYRGNISTLIPLICRSRGKLCSVTCVSPFDGAGDAVSQYKVDIDYLKDTKQNFTHFNLEQPEYIIGYSNAAPVIERLRGRKWNLIYVDGNHDYEVVRADLMLSLDLLVENGFIVMDDSALFTDYKPVSFASKGHPGPSRTVDEMIKAGRIVEVAAIGHNRVFQRVPNGIPSDSGA